MKRFGVALAASVALNLALWLLSLPGWFSSVVDVFAWPSLLTAYLAGEGSAQFIYVIAFFTVQILFYALVFWGVLTLWQTQRLRAQAANERK